MDCVVKIGKEEFKFMFNKIIASVVSSIVMFACNVKDSTDGDVTSSADVVSSVSTPAPEAVKTQDEPVVAPATPTPQTSVPNQVSSPAAPTGGVAGGASPLATSNVGAAPVVNPVSNGSTTSPGSVIAQPTTPAMTPSSATSVSK